MLALEEIWLVEFQHKSGDSVLLLLPMLLQIDSQRMLLVFCLLHFRLVYDFLESCLDSFYFALQNLDSFDLKAESDLTFPQPENCT